MGMGGEFGKYVLRTRRPEDAARFAEDFQRQARDAQRRRSESRTENAVGAVVLLVVVAGLVAWGVFAG